MAKVQTARVGKPGPRVKLDLDQALIALFVAAMNANLHVAPDEAERAHHLIWSTRRFRRKSGDVVGKLIQDMRVLLQEGETDAVLDGAARAIPARLRPAAFAVLADLLLADGRMDAQEQKFLRGIGAKLQIKPETVRRVADVILLKNEL